MAATNENGRVRVLLPTEEIERRTAELAAEIDRDYAHASASTR